jgi:hypothetical protein
MIRYYLNLLWFIFSKNLVKFALLVTAFVSFFFAGTLPEVTYKKEVLVEHKQGPDFIYIVRDKDKETGYDILVSQVKHQLSDDNYLSVEEFNELNVLIWLLFGICLVSLSIGTILGINGDDDIGWVIKDCKEMAVNNLVRCELEDGVYYYMALGRLLGKSNTQVRGATIRHFGIHCLSDLKRCPKFITKEAKRNNILKKIGIN